MSSVLDDINKRRTRQSVGEQQPTAPVEPVAPVAQPMGDQAAARVYQGENGLNPTAEQKATAMMLVNPALTAPAAAPVVAEPAKPKTYTDMVRELYPGLTPEEKAAQQKRQRNRQVINAIGDGITALANLYYTNKSGVNAYDPSTSLTKAAKERYDKILAQQKADADKRKALLLSAGQLDLQTEYQRKKDAQEQANKDRSYNLALTQFLHKKDLEDAKEEREAELASLELLYKQGRLTEQAYRTEKARVEAQYAGKVQQSIVYRNNAAGANSDRGNRGEIVVYDQEGNPHTFKDKYAAEQAARGFGTYNDVFVEEESQTVGPDPDIPGKTTTKTTKTKKPRGWYSAPPKKGASPMKKENKNNTGNGGY